MTNPRTRTEIRSSDGNVTWDAAPLMLQASRNVALVQRAYDAFTRRDVEGLVATCSEDIEFHLPTAQLTRVGLPYRGHDGVRTYMRDAARVWSELRLEPREFHEAEDVVVAVGRVYAWGAGRVVDTPAAWVWRIRDGLAVRLDVYESSDEALAAAGIAG
jgi:ketosteroid isomerase-like protein